MTWSNVAAGSYSLTATATDELGSQTRSAAVAITVTAASTGAPRILYLHGDHLGTPRVATDAANQVVWRNLPLGEPFGVTPPEEDPDGDGQATVINLRFPGQYFDRETGLSYNYFRDYDPGTGRYVQSDPIGLEGGINTYLYVGANPLSFVDIFGLYKCSCRTTATTEQGGGIAARNPRLRPGETNAAGEPYQVKYFWYSCRCDCPGKSPVDIDVFGGSDDYGKGNQFPHGTSDFLKWPYLPTVKGNFVQTPRWEGGAKSFKVDTEEWFFPNPDLDDIKNGINDQMQEKCPCKKQ